MSFKAWNLQISQSRPMSDRLRAKLWNLTSEMRIRGQLSLFRRRVGRLYKDALAIGLPPNDACLRALQTACEELSKPTCAWLGLLPVTPRRRLPQFMLTHIPALDFAKKYAKAPINLLNPPRRVRFNRPYKTSTTPTEPICRFIWLTFVLPPDSIRRSHNHCV